MNPARICFMAFAGFFFVRNFFMPLTHDDFAYAFIWAGDDGGNLDAMKTGAERVRVESLGDIFESQLSHWQTWGGRIIAHSLAQFFIWQGKIFFDVANTIVLAVLVWLILRLAGAPLKILPVAWVFCGLMFLAGESAVTTLWLTGACNYLWMALFQLGFLLPYVEAIRAGKNFPAWLMILAGILAGWSNEAGALATVFLTAFLLGILRRKKILVQWMLAGFSALIVGSALNILAPGNFAQAEFIQSVNPQFNFTPELFLNHLTSGFLPVVALDFVALLPLLALRKKPEILILGFIAAGFLVPVAMMFSPKFDLRVSIISLEFILVAAAYGCAEIKKLPTKICRGVAAALILYSASLIYTDISVSRAVNENLRYIERHKADAVIILEPLEISRIFEPVQGGLVASPWLRYFGGVTENENYCLNVLAAKYYGAKKIVAGTH